MKHQFKSRKQVSKYLLEKGIDTSDWTEEKWLSINKGQAEIHMMALAESMWDAYNESTPKELKAGEWHIPFNLNIDDIDDNPESLMRVKIATARCARVSYTVVGEEGKKPNYENDLKLHDILSTSGHWSPFEHCAKAMNGQDYYNFRKGWHDRKEVTDQDGNGNIYGWCNNFRGFIQYRYLLENK